MRPVTEGRILGVEAGLDGMAPQPRLEGVGRERPALGHGELERDEVEAGDELGHRVLDLQARVHLEERELAARVEEELDRPGPDVSDGARRTHGGIAHRGAQLASTQRATVTPR